MKSFLDHIPPPEFLSMPAVGVDISDGWIRFIGFKGKGKHRMLDLYGSVPLGDGVIVDRYVNEPEKVTALLKDIKEKNDLSFVNVSLPEEKAYIFTTTIPKVSVKEIRNALEFRIEENVPVSTADAVFDYSVITKKSESNPDHIDVGVAVLPEKVSETYISIIKNAGLSVKSFDIEPRAVARAIIPEDDNRTFVVVNFKEYKTGLYIVNNGVVQFTSTISMGGGEITGAIKDHFSVSSDKVQDVKVKKDTESSKDDKNPVSSLVDTVSSLKREIDKLLTYWNSRKEKDGNPAPTVDLVLLVGKNAGFEGFSEYLSSFLKIEVEIADVWQKSFTVSDYIPPIHFSESLSYSAAIGSALRE